MLYIHKLVFTETTELFANNNHNGNSTHIEMNRVKKIVVENLFLGLILENPISEI
jgi:hypothetical protein